MGTLGPVVCCSKMACPTGGENLKEAVCTSCGTKLRVSARFTPLFADQSNVTSLPATF